MVVDVLPAWFQSIALYAGDTGMQYDVSSTFFFAFVSSFRESVLNLLPLNDTFIFLRFENGYKKKKPIRDVKYILTIHDNCYPLFLSPENNTAVDAAAWLQSWLYARERGNAGCKF